MSADIKKKLMKLLIDVAVILLGVFLVAFCYEPWFNGSGRVFNLLFLFGLILALGASAVFVFLWIDLGKELRQSPSLLVFLITFIFFGIPQLLLGIAYIAFILITIFPFGFFSLHKTLPPAGEHFHNALSWPGRQKRAEQHGQSSETLAQKLVYQQLETSKNKGKKETSQKEEQAMRSAPFAQQQEVCSAPFEKDVYDYVSYIEKITGSIPKN